MSDALRAVGVQSGPDLLGRLRGTGPAHAEAEDELHVLLLCAARFEVGRRATALGRDPAGELDDLAGRAADDACLAVIGQLDQFRGASRFGTWAAKFALHEAAVRMRRAAPGLRAGGSPPRAA